MIAVLDVHYDEDASTGTAAAIVFEHWEDTQPTAQYTAQCGGVRSYVPGEFFKRELPCLLAVLAKVQEPLNQIVIDGYVSLGDRPGLGMYLWEALGGKVPIIGVAKTRFHSANAIEVLRGQSHAPLYVTAVGVDPAEAAQRVSEMAGEFRIPDMQRRVDQLARTK